MSVFLTLPTEIAGEVVGQWLCLEDVVRLDSAFCHHVMKNVLLESIFQSPLCIVTIANQRHLMAPEIFTWVSMKCVRLSNLLVTNVTGFDNCEEYLKRFGGTVHSVVVRHCRGDSALPLTLVPRYCTNLSVLTMFFCDLDPCVDILKSCPRLRSIEIESSTYSMPSISSIPTTQHLQIASISLECSTRDEEMIFGMCDPLCVQRLKLTNSQCPQWQTFVNLRSFRFQYEPLIGEANELVQICTLCPWIVNLELYSSGWLSDGIIIPAIPALKRIRTFCCEYAANLTDHVLHTLIEHHKHMLEAVYLYRCDAMSSTAKNRLLKECVKLHTLSCSVKGDINFSLMGNLTTLNINFPSVNVWNGVQQHCHSLQCLHLVPPRYGTAVNSHIVVDAGNLQALRTVFTVRAYLHDLRLQLPSICVAEEEDGEWYDLFKLPI